MDRNTPRRICSVRPLGSPFRALQLLAAVVFLAPGGTLHGQDAAGPEPPDSETVRGIDVRSFSGSPLLLEIDIDDADRSVRAVAVATSVSSHSFAIPPRESGDAVHLRISPFLEPGIYDVTFTVTSQTPDGAMVTDERAIRIGFVDFVFGRDNLRFGNNADYRSSIGTFGEILTDWLDARFGGVGEAQSVLLVDYMYGFFGRATGRCYAFSGTEIRYWKRTDLLPSYYDGAYDIRPANTRYQREMGYLQLDMAFANFLAGGTPRVFFGAMDGDQVAEQISLITSHIRDGRPVAVGFTGPDLHHSMVAFGFVENPAAGRFDILVANNWKDEEDLNLRSRDAEIVRIRIPEGGEAPEFQWIYDEGTRNRDIDRLFPVEVPPPDYQHQREDLDALLATLMDRLRAAGRGLVVVEEAAGAWLTDGEHSAGRLKSRTLEEIEGVIFDRVSRVYRFEYPLDLRLQLEISDDAGARVLWLAPGDLPGSEVTWIRKTAPPEDGKAITRRIDLANGEPAFEAVANSEQETPVAP